MLNNRDIKSFVNTFKQHIHKAFVISIPNVSNSYEPNDMCSRLIGTGIETHPMKSFEEALKYSDRELPLLITGSLYLAGYVLKINKTKIL